jgi:hypothetical protein
MTAIDKTMSDRAVSLTGAGGRRYILRMSGRNFWRFYVGRNPRHLPQKSVVVFPILPNTLFCGLAGIVAIKGAMRKPGLIQRLISLYEDISAKGLDKASAGEFLALEAPSEKPWN